MPLPSFVLSTDAIGVPRAEVAARFPKLSPNLQCHSDTKGKYLEVPLRDIFHFHFEIFPRFGVNKWLLVEKTCADILYAKQLHVDKSLVSALALFCRLYVRPKKSDQVKFLN